MKLHSIFLEEGTWEKLKQRFRKEECTSVADLIRKIIKEYLDKF